MDLQENKTIEATRFRVVFCPACSKQRLKRNWIDEENDVYEAASTETYVVRGESRYKDCCEFCENKYLRKDILWAQEEIAKSQAIEEARQKGDDPDVDLA